MDTADVSPGKVFTDRRELTGPFDIIGDVPGGRTEVASPLGLAYESEPVDHGCEVPGFRLPGRALPAGPVAWFVVEPQAVNVALGNILAINPLNATELLATFGLIGVLVIVFAETGLLIGFFFPGDSLLFLAGIGASPFANVILPGVQLNIWALLIGAPVCAIAGAQLGHLLGSRYGRRMFDRPNSKIFKPVYVEKAEYYFNKFGPAKAVLLARFIPVVRTFLNPVAGVLEMPARQFFVYNLIGGLVWTEGMLLLGYYAANQITRFIPKDKIDSYLVPVVLLIAVVSALPIFIEIYRGWREKKHADA